MDEFAGRSRMLTMMNILYSSRTALDSRCFGALFRVAKLVIACTVMLTLDTPLIGIVPVIERSSVSRPIHDAAGSRSIEITTSPADHRCGARSTTKASER